MTRAGRFLLAAGLLAAGGAGAGLYAARRAAATLTAALPGERELAAWTESLISPAPADVAPVRWPGGWGEVEISLGEAPAPGMRASGLRARLVPGGAGRPVDGYFSQIVIECDRLELRGRTFEGLRLDARNVRLDLPRLIGKKEVGFFEIGELRPTVSFDADRLGEFRPGLSAAGDALRLARRIGPFSVEAELGLGLAADRSAAVVTVRGLRAAGVPLGGAGKKRISLSAGKFPVKLREVSVKEGRIRITGESD